MSSQKKKCAKTIPLVLDMVHHNPGEEPYESKFNDPDTLAKMGYNGKVYFLFDSPQLAVNWDSVDPDIFPQGSCDRDWVDVKAVQIRNELEKCKKAGLKIYAQSDLVLFPKRLIEKKNMQSSLGNPQNPCTVKYLKVLFNLIFEQFPALDGLVVRIGETYLHDAPYHQGAIDHIKSADKTIIPLVRLLREEICQRHDKQVIFRSWFILDEDLDRYSKVNDAIEPHPNLFFSVKHCENDFHRANPFCRILGQGRHQQVIEVQCAREYEGKGAYPNYIANGVIEGFEEHRKPLAGNRIDSIRQLYEETDLLKGIWTWSRGGGWGGPYIKSEFWCELNACIMAMWANDPMESEEAIFNKFAQENLHLTGKSLQDFRTLCLLTADAVIRGKNSTHRDLDPWWTRDDCIGWPVLPKNQEQIERILKQKDEAAVLWQQIVQLAEGIEFKDKDVYDYVVISSKYGFLLFKLYKAVFYLASLENSDNVKGLEKWTQEYDLVWEEFKSLGQNASCAELYRRHAIKYLEVKPADQKVLEIKKRIRNN